MLADHLFSPALYLAERIERRLLRAAGRTVIELGAGSGLPSLLLATLPDPPSLVVITDHPDPGILGNLKTNIEQNKQHFQPYCRVDCEGHEWGTDVERLLKLLPCASIQGYDVVILSDLLHFHSSHDALLASVKALLSTSKNSQVYVSAGTYTRAHVCDGFLQKGRETGFTFEEIFTNSEEARWMGEMKVSGLDSKALALRKAACRYWIGTWTP